jgi:hypothetical protein
MAAVIYCVHNHGGNFTVAVAVFVALADCLSRIPLLITHEFM